MKYKIIFCLLLSLFVFSSTAYAESTRSAQVIPPCQKVLDRLDQTINNYQTRKDLHLVIYQKQLTRWQNLANTLESQGTDVTTLRSHLVQLDGQIKTLATAYQSFTTTLSDLKITACELNIYQIRAKLSEAKTQLQPFKTQSKLVRNFIKTTIRADLVSLARQLKPTPTP